MDTKTTQSSLTKTTWSRLNPFEDKMRAYKRIARILEFAILFLLFFSVISLFAETSEAKKKIEKQQVDRIIGSIR